MIGKIVFVDGREEEINNGVIAGAVVMMTTNMGRYIYDRNTDICVLVEYPITNYKDIQDIKSFSFMTEMEDDGEDVSCYGCNYEVKKKAEV